VRGYVGVSVDVYRTGYDYGKSEAIFFDDDLAGFGVRIRAGGAAGATAGAR
jgi:hypothetical protein